MPALEQSPYPVGTLVCDPRLLQARRNEIELAVDALAGLSGDGRHVVLLGEQRSGKSSVVAEVGRRLGNDANCLVVPIQGGAQVLQTRQALQRGLLTSMVEALAERDEHSRLWYAAWRDRVHLRDRRPSDENDVLSSALAYAFNPEAVLDVPVFERDLRKLREVGARAGFERLIASVDDASVLTEDMELVEEMVSLFDQLGGYGLLMAGLPTIATHFIEAASPCLSRFKPVWLRPFRNLRQIFTSLHAPLAESDGDWVRTEDTGFLRDVLRLTSGNPFELMLVAQQLWYSCRSGEQERYSLTPKVLDRLIPRLALLAAGGDALLDGAAAIDRLPEEQAREAVELIALSRLTFRQIAVARILGVDSRDSDRLDRRILDADIAAEEASIRERVEALELAGVVQIQSGGDGFTIVGGRPAEVLLKYKARTRIGVEASRQPFELGYLSAVGRALARDLTITALEQPPPFRSLGFTTLLSNGGAGRLSPRPALQAVDKRGDFEQLAQAELDVIPWTSDDFDRISDLLASDDVTVALVYTSLRDGSEQLEYTELWELPQGTTHLEVATRLSSTVEDWQPLVAAAELGWDGCESVVLAGDDARAGLVVLERYAATNAVHTLFARWTDTREPADLARAQTLSWEAIELLRSTGLTDTQLAGELSGLLSRAGFLASFTDELLPDAAEALEEALNGEADGWVTKWNLMNVRARLNDLDAALRILAEVEQMADGWLGSATILFWVPGRPAGDSIVQLTELGLEPLIALQRAVLSSGRCDTREVGEAVAACLDCGESSALEAAGWVQSAGSADQ